MVIETENHIFTLEGDVIHGYVKPIKPTKEMIMESIEAMKEIGGGKKVLLIADPTDAVVLTKDQREFLIREFDEIVGGMAVINRNLIVHIMFNFMMKVDKPLFPMKSFKTKNNAIKWLKEQK